MILTRKMNEDAVAHNKGRVTPTNPKQKITSHEDKFLIFTEDAVAQ